MKRSVLVLVILMLVGGMLFAAAGREGGAAGELGNYPSKPITCVVPYAPGGGTDLFVRTLLRYANPKLRHPIAVVNVDGAAGFIGAMQVYHGSNDGYTILAHNGMDLVVFTLSGRTDLKLWQEFVPICWAVTDYQGVFTSSQSGFRTIDELVAHARANPGTMTYGTVGARTMNNLNATQILEGLGLSGLVRLVPYDGGAQIRTAILGGHIQMAQASLGDFGPAIQSGDLRPLLLVSPRRTNLAPDVPTTGERGMPRATTLIPRGFYGPPGMNPAQARFLEGVFKEAVENPEFVADITKAFTDAFFVSAADVFKQSEEAFSILAPLWENF